MASLKFYNKYYFFTLVLCLLSNFKIPVQLILQKLNIIKIAPKIAISWSMVFENGAFDK